MPIYEYTCVTCYNRFDKRRSMSQMNDPAPCPDCGSESRRVFSADGRGQTSAVAGAGGCCGGSAGGACACAMGV